MAFFRFASLIAWALLFATPAWADPLVVASDDEPREWACSSENMEQALERTKKRLVHVNGRMDSAVGFVFHSPNHVLTTFSAVFWQESQRVILPDGSTSTVRVVAHDSDNDLAIIELDHAVKATPMETGPSVHVGDPVFAIGLTGFQGDPSIHPGVVNSVGKKVFHSDALEASFLRSGGPMLDCQGRLVGIATSSWDKSVVPIAHATALADQIGAQDIYEGPVVRPHVEFGAPIHVDEHAAGAGIALGLGMTIQPGIEIKLRGGVVVLKELNGEHDGMRVFAQSLLGYRLHFDDDRDFSMTGMAGLTFAHDRFCRHNCGEDESPFILRNRFMPTVELGFQFWPGAVSYQYVMDVEIRELSTHQIMLGIEF